jgi:hypothetical protein
MPKLHVPTLGASVLFILVALLVYHFLIAKK